MPKVLLFSDPHITDGTPIIGLDPAARFALALEHALARHGDAARVIVLGDLTHHGRVEQYHQMRDLLAGCPLPVTLMLGNHDRRAPFLAAFPDTTTASGFVQSFHDIGTHRLICLDTLDEGPPATHSGLICAKRQAWLLEALDTDQTCTVLMHHPPAPLGFPGMDRIRLRNGAQVVSLLTEHGARQLICAHVHRTIMGNIGGLPVALLKSTCHQMPMDLLSASSALSVDEPAAYGVLLLGEDQVTLLPEDVGLPDAVPQSDMHSQD